MPNPSQNFGFRMASIPGCVTNKLYCCRGRSTRNLLLTMLLLGVAIASPLAHAAPVDAYRVLHTYPHDGNAFTQGLIFLDGKLYESTGLPGRSSLRKVNLDDGRVEKQHDVAAQFFAEGLTHWGNTLVQLTWKSQKGFVYDRSSFRLLRTFEYSGEGWGLTQDGVHLILSDGSSSLRFLDPKTFREVRKFSVTDDGKPVTQLNELEYIHGEIYANIWQSNRIARIAPATGKVLGWIDLTGILSAADSTQADVLNGIAYDPQKKRLFVTGKLWPKLFEIQVLSWGSASARKKPASHPGLVL